jgi:hypothetical protein
MKSISKLGRPVDIGQTGTFIKGVSLDCGKGTVVWEVDLRQAGTLSKGTLPNFGEGRREMEFRQAGASNKGTLPDYLK